MEGELGFDISWFRKWRLEKVRAQKVERFGLDLKIFTKCSFKYGSYPKCDVAILKKCRDIVDTMSRH